MNKEQAKIVKSKYNNVYKLVFKRWKLNDWEIDIGWARGQGVIFWDCAWPFYRTVVSGFSCWAIALFVIGFYLASCVSSL